MEITTNRLDFVTIEGLWHTQRNLPDIRPPQMCSCRRRVQAGDRAQRAQAAMDSLRRFVQDAADRLRRIAQPGVR